MARLPDPLNTTTAAIYAAYEADAEDGHRPHLGCSLAGHPCERYLWNTFRWVKAKRFVGRMLRLFETGQLEEARLVRNLRRIGVEVHDRDPEGRQWRVRAIGGHAGGSMDAAGKGFPEAPTKWHVVEIKTSNDKAFKELVRDGVAKAKPQHHGQVQLYMGLAGMERAMYLCVNKNTDEIYTERVRFDHAEFDRLMQRAERVITAAEPPLRCSDDPSWYVCKMCDFHSICHGQDAPEVNCRTCAHATAELDGDARWSCTRWACDIPEDAQRKGCSEHRYIPILLERFATQKDVVDGDVMYQTPAGGVFANGEPNNGALASTEIFGCESKAMLADCYSIKRQLLGLEEAA